MQNKANEIIETFKKHIKEQGIEPQSLAKNALSNIEAIQSAKTHLPFVAQRKIRNFGEDIKSANELTGALQTLQITFKKLLSLADELDEMDNATKSSDEAMQKKSQILAQIKERVEMATFMGEGLFDTALSAKMGNKEILLENPSPMPLLENDNAKSAKIGHFKTYIEEKSLEINEALSHLSNAISNAEIFDKAQDFGDFDSSADSSVFERFDKNIFRNMK
ncbi:flagellar FLiS export co-chaperone [Helicobacter sp. T3_23-1059]